MKINNGKLESVLNKDIKDRQVNFPESVTSIGLYAFSGYHSLTSITIPEGVTSIGREAFGDCRNLTSITIPESVTWIGDWAFRGCPNLENIYIDTIDENQLKKNTTSSTTRITRPRKNAKPGAHRVL